MMQSLNGHYIKPVKLFKASAHQKIFEEGHHTVKKCTINIMFNEETLELSLKNQDKDITL